MSIIRCLKCNRRISDQLSSCEHCGFGGLGQDPERIEELKRRVYREKRYRLTMRSYLGLTVFTIGMLWYWVDSGGFNSSPETGPVILLVIGAIGYFVIRAMMVLLKMRNRRR